MIIHIVKYEGGTDDASKGSYIDYCGSDDLQFEIQQNQISKDRCVDAEQY